MTSHDAFTRWTSRVLTVPSLQRLKMESLIPEPADCEVRSVITFLNAQSIASIERRRQLCQVYGSNVIMSKQMVRRWYREFTKGRQHVHDEERNGRHSIITDELVRDPRPQWFPSFVTPQEILIRSASAFSEWQAEMSVTQWFQSQAADFYNTGIKKVDPLLMTNVSFPELNTYVEK